MDGGLITAVQLAELPEIWRLLDELPDDALAGEDGSVLLRAAAEAGRGDVVDALVDHGADPERLWTDGTHPVLWAADHGSPTVLNGLVGIALGYWRKKVSKATLRAALYSARAWLDRDPEAELRRRLGIPDGEPAVVARTRDPADVYMPQLIRMRVTAGDGRWLEVWIGHRAVVTFLEQELGIPTEPDELLARALYHADPDSWDWAQSQQRLDPRLDPVGRARILQWGAGRLDDPDPNVRRFVAELIHALGFNQLEDDDHAAATRAALEPRLVAEQDEVALSSVIGAYSEHLGDGAAFLFHARHPDPRIRWRVAGELYAAVAQPVVLTSLTDLAGDPDGTVRRVALRVLADSPLDTPQVRDLMAAHLHDPDDEAAIEAAAGLALRDEPAALAALRRMTIAGGEESQHRWRLDSVERTLDYRRKQAGSSAG